MDDLQHSSTHTTIDIRLAFFLVARGHTVRLTRRGPNLCQFHFTDTPTLREDVASYNDGSALVSPHDLDAARVTVRTLMRQATGGGR